jgi:Rha family phage regulatory protein
MSTDLTEILVVQQGSQFFVDSLQVAEKFGKEHKNVLRDIKELEKSLVDAKIDRLRFEPISYADAYDRTQIKINMDKTSFLILATTFSGKEALLWKMRFVEAFEKMERALNEMLPVLEEELSKAHREIKSLRRKRQTSRGSLGEIAWVVAGFDSAGRTKFKQKPRNQCSEIEINQGYVAKNRRQTSTLISRSKEAIVRLRDQNVIVYFDDFKSTCENNPQHVALLLEFKPGPTLWLPPKV